MTHPRVFSPPTSLQRALATLEEILKSPSVRVLSPGERYWSFLDRAARDGKATGNLVFDAQIAAVCTEAGVTTIFTEDRDFARFPGLATESI